MHQKKIFLWKKAINSCGFSKDFSEQAAKLWCTEYSSTQGTFYLPLKAYNTAN